MKIDGNQYVLDSGDWLVGKLKGEGVKAVYTGVFDIVLLDIN